MLYLDYGVTFIEKIDLTLIQYTHSTDNDPNRLCRVKIIVLQGIVLKHPVKEADTWHISETMKNKREIS